jgi:hypothetical protein
MYRCWKKRLWWHMTGPSSWHGSALDFLWFQVHCSSVLQPAYTQSERQRKWRMCSILCQVCTAVGLTAFQGAESMMLHFSYFHTPILNSPGMGSEWKFGGHNWTSLKILTHWVIFLWKYAHLMICWCHKYISWEIRLWSKDNHFLK